MRTTKLLMDATKYKSGKPAYKGAIHSLYGSTIHSTISIHPQMSHAKKIVLPVDSEISTACKQLQKGQIGARKVTSIISGGTTVISEIVAEAETLDTAYEVTKPQGKIISSWLNDVLSYKDSKGQMLTFDQVNATRADYLKVNESLREKIELLKKQQNYKKGTKMSDTLLSDIQSVYEQMYSLTGMDLVITISERHYINMNNDYVICSNPDNLKEMQDYANYNKSGNRLVGTAPVIRYVVPIQSLNQIAQIKELLEKKYLTRLLKLRHDIVCSDSYNPKGLDLEAAREHDRKLSV